MWGALQRQQGNWRVERGAGYGERQWFPEIRGAAAIAKAVEWRATSAGPALVNGAVGIVVAPRGRLLLALCLKMKGEKIVEIEVIGEPERLRQLDLAVLDD